MTALLRILLAGAALSISQPAYAQRMQSCYDPSHQVEVADGIATVCSATWQFNGTCDGLDMWKRWNINGRTNPPDAFVRPWLDYPITIVGLELVKITLNPPPQPCQGLQRWLKSDACGQEDLNPTRSWFMVGSTIGGDAMLWLAPGETHAKQMWAAGRGQPWPSSADAVAIKPTYDASGEMIGASGDLLDLHGACFGGGRISIFLTLYYTQKATRQ